MTDDSLFLPEDIRGDRGQDNRLHMMDEKSWLATFSAGSKKSNK